MSALLANRSGQLKIQQMIFMLLAVFFFFILVLLFYLMIQIGNIKGSVVGLERDKAVGLVTKIASSPELTFENIPNSVDEDKLMILKNSQQYTSFWGINGIIVRIIYPQQNASECRISNYPDCNLIKLFTQENSSSISSFVSVCRKENNQGHSYNYCQIGELMIIPKP